MDANLYEIDSPYTNLTTKMDAQYICKQNRRARRDRCVAGLLAMAVLICITSCVVSCVCALYCVRASGAVQAAEERLLKQQPMTGAAGVPDPHTEAMIDFKQFQGLGLLDDYVDDDDTQEQSENSDVGDEDDYLDSEDDMEYIDDLDDDGDDDDDDDDGEEDSEEDSYEDLDSDNMELSDQESGDYPVDQDSSFLDVTGYSSDDEDFSVEGSGIQEPMGTKLRTRREVATQNTKKSRKNNKGKKGKKQGEKQGENTTEKRGKKIKKARLRFLPAAQFDGSIDHEAIKKACPEYLKYGSKVCTHVPDMEGTLCTNKSFIPDKTNQALKILKPESWVTKNTSPVDFNDSTLIVRSNGVYLVYAQVLFSGYEAKNSASAIVTSGDNKQALSCNADVSTNNLVLEEVPGVNLRTCTIVGLLYLKKGDTLELQTGNRRAPIERKEGATYFGIVQLNKDK